MSSGTLVNSEEVPMPKGELKRYNLALPQELFDQIEDVAQQRHTTVVEVLRSFIRLGLIAVQMDGSSDSALILREGDKERQVLVI
jgi:hypothetical protein